MGQLPSRTVLGCIDQPGVGQVRSRTVQGCTGIPVVRQLTSRTVQGCKVIPGQVSCRAERYMADKVCQG